MTTVVRDQSSNFFECSHKPGRRRRAALMTLAGLLALLPVASFAGGSSAFSASAAQSSPEPEPHEDLMWDIFLELLEVLQRLLNEMEPMEATPATAEGWIDLIAATYQANGAPVGLSPQQTADALLTIETTYRWAAHFSALIDPNRVLVLQETLRSLYIDLGGDPQNLQ